MQNLFKTSTHLLYVHVANPCLFFVGGRTFDRKTAKERGLITRGMEEAKEGGGEKFPLGRKGKQGKRWEEHLLQAMHNLLLWYYGGGGGRRGSRFSI